MTVSRKGANTAHAKWRTDGQGRQVEWEGGYIRYDERGVATWYLQRRRNGKRGHFVAGTDERSALLALGEFRRCGTRTGPPSPGENGDAPAPVYFTAALAREYTDYCARPKDSGGAENTPAWCDRKKDVLKWWQERLVDDRGRSLDLRRVPRHLVPRLLDGERDPRKPDRWLVPPVPDARTKRNVIKGFYSWLRTKKRLVSAAEDPVIDLPVGQGRSAIRHGGVPKDRVPPDHVKRVIGLGEEQGTLYAHILKVQAGTGGWHTTEMERFVAGGAIDEIHPEQAQDGTICVAELICPRHKNGEQFRTKVTQSVLESARVILDKSHRPHGCVVPGCVEPHLSRNLCRKHYQQWKSGSLEHTGKAGQPVGHHGWHRGKGRVARSFSRRNYELWVHESCDELGIPRFNPSWLRHTNATFARRQGESAANVGRRMGHAAGSDMVDRFYAPNVAAPKMPTIVDDLDKPAPGLARPTLAQPPPAPPDLVEKLEALLSQLKGPR